LISGTPVEELGEHFLDGITYRVRRSPDQYGKRYTNSADQNHHADCKIQCCICTHGEVCAYSRTDASAPQREPASSSAQMARECNERF